MTSLASTAPRISADRRFALCVLILAVLTGVRLIALTFSQVDLFFDESQYWAWSRELSFGYFSKPPLLAWSIAAAEFVCGSAEACIRAPAPIFYFGTCIVSYLIAEALYDEETAFWAAMLLAFNAAVAFSSRIISTDVPLLFFWAVALLAYVKLLQGGGWRWGALLGVAFGLGMLAKYAMIYFVLCVAVAALVDRGARALLRAPSLWIAVPIAGVLMLPNIIWNASNSFVTLQHVGDNISGDGAVFSLTKGFEFLASQFGVFGPVVFAVLLLVLVCAARPEITRADRLLLCFALPALVLVGATAFVTRAFANWAAVSCIPATVLAAGVLVRRGAWRWIGLSVAIGIVAQLLLPIGDANARRISLPFLANPDIYARTMGWHALGDQAAALAHRTGAATVAAEGRDDVASLIYYLRHRGLPVLAWPAGPVPTHHFDLTRRLTAAAAEPVLLITRCAAAERLAASYRTAEPLGPFQIQSGPHSTRRYFAFRLAGHAAEIAPMPGC